MVYIIRPKLIQCMTHMCHACFWLYRESQIITCGTLDVSDEFVQYVYSEENLTQHPCIGGMIDVSVDDREPESDIYIRGVDSPTYISLLGCNRYEWVPPRSMPYMKLVLDAIQNPCNVIEMDDLIMEHDRIRDIENELVKQRVKSESDISRKRVRDESFQMPAPKPKRMSTRLSIINDSLTAHARLDPSDL